MKSIRNKTRKPLRIPLPAGKTLHLGPGATAPLAAKAAEHPPLRKLVEAGEVEILEEGRPSGDRYGGGQKGLSESPGHRGSGDVRHTGDR
ncbi:MAG: hypothetical protein AB1726_07265 [Planctomycetota bacterium]